MKNKNNLKVMEAENEKSKKESMAESGLNLNELGSPGDVRGKDDATSHHSHDVDKSSKKSGIFGKSGDNVLGGVLESAEQKH